MTPSPATPSHAHSGRRQFLKTTAAGVAGASLLTMLQARQAPAQIKGTSLRVLQWSHFVPAYDTWFDGFVKKWGEQNGVKVRVDRIPHLDLHRVHHRLQGVVLQDGRRVDDGDLDHASASLAVLAF